MRVSWLTVMFAAACGASHGPAVAVEGGQGGASTAPDGGRSYAVTGLQHSTQGTSGGAAPSSTTAGVGPANDVALPSVDPGFSFEPDGDDAGVDLALANGEQITILVIFDKSGSMAAPWGDSNRWNSASEAMLRAFWPAAGRLTIGALLFPQVTQCGVPGLDHPQQLQFMPGEDFIEEWVARAPKNGPTGSTPMGEAFSVADRTIEAALAEGPPAGRFQVIVLTDGEPNCDTEVERLVEWPARWLSQDIKTYVMGLPGSEPAQQLLDQIALAGGTEHHQSVGSPGELMAAFAATL